MNNPPTPPLSQDMLDRMEKKILQNRPQIKKIKSMYGHLSYFEYVKQKSRTSPNIFFKERKKEVTEVICDETKRLLGSKIAEDVEKQLRRNDSVSTAEHVAPIGTPHTLSAGLHMGVPAFEANGEQRNLIILSCAGISFNNVLSFSRGFQFHSFKDKNTIDNTITFFGRSVDSNTILYAPAYTNDSIADIHKKLATLIQEESITESMAEKLKTLLTEIYATPEALSAPDYADQLTITNYHLWQKLFPSFSPEKIPNYIMLSQEKILLELLLRFHLYQETPIHRFLFNPTYHELIEKHFGGITGAFAKDYSTGTFLFWGLSKKDQTRFSLRRVNNTLVNKDDTYVLELTPDAVEKAIRNHEIFPSLLLTFSVFSFYYGLLLGGGASQTTYLTHMKNAYTEMMLEVNDLQSAKNSEESVTDDFVFYRPHLAFIEAFGERISATGLDMYLYQDPDAWKKIIEATKVIPIADFITILLPILYKQFCPDEEKEDDLMNISRQDVEQFIGFDKKLPPLGIIE